MLKKILNALIIKFLVKNKFEIIIILSSCKFVLYEKKRIFQKNDPIKNGFHRF